MTLSNTLLVNGMEIWHNLCPLFKESLKGRSETMAPHEPQVLYLDTQSNIINK
jgi:hypothetical protein